MAPHQPSPDSQTTQDARLVYNYHRMNMPLPAGGADAIFALCSLDVRVARRAAQLHLAGHARYLIFSGGTGKLTSGLALFGGDPEAVVFARIAVAMGVPEGAVIVEPRSTNTGENVRFTHELLAERGLLPGGSAGRTIRSFILVQKPYMERRTYATFMRQWPGVALKSSEGDGQSFEFTVTSPQLDFDEYFDEDNPWDKVLGIMVGDLVRIREYPEKGYQIPQDIPSHVWDAGQRLIERGFNGHLP